MWEIPGPFSMPVIETSFFTSLSHVAKLYQFATPDYSDKPVPYNMYAAFCHAENIIKKTDKELELMLISDDAHPATLATVKTFSTDYYFYYLPVEPLCKLLADAARKDRAALLQAIFSYLYQRIQYPFFADNATSLGNAYCYIEEWIDSSPDDWEEEDFREIKRQFKTIKKGGKKIKRLISKPLTAVLLEKKIQACKIIDEKDERLHKIAAMTISLWKNFPSANLISSIPHAFTEPQIEDRVYFDDYISFIWDTNDSVYDHVLDYMNSNLQERGWKDEPLSIQLFDQPHNVVQHDLAFETGLFDLIEELADFLNNEL
jgi:hypothetical protein